MLVAPNTPTTAWIRDSGTTYEASTLVLADELGDTLVDESGLELLDAISTDGEPLAQSWDGEAEVNTMWANAFEPRISTATRVTAQGDTRVTVQGDTRVSRVSDANREPLTTWTQDEY